SIEDPTLSIMFWHTQQFFPVKVGDTVLQGQVIAQMGNSGYVVDGGYVPLDERNKYPYRGTHTHISFGTETENLDFSKYVDFSIPINYDVITTVKSIIQNITNFLLNK
ncbi:M23 family metallopeptidase, partial [Patescibacteria group bacterium]|nr:M23 family metallopeptidase [Patescibacteria group bacterium]